jgi:hypothetical protein
MKIGGRVWCCSKTMKSAKNDLKQKQPAYIPCLFNSLTNLIRKEKFRQEKNSSKKETKLDQESQAFVNCDIIIKKM